MITTTPQRQAPKNINPARGHNLSRIPLHTKDEPETAGRANAHPFYARFTTPATVGFKSKTRGVHTKPAFSRNTEVSEQKADRIADQVMHMTDIEERLSTDLEPAINIRKIKEPMSENGFSVGNGKPLPQSTCYFFESKFGRSFADIRVYNDDVAAEAARSFKANAFTFGRHIVFSNGLFSPATYAGKRLISHKLAHTLGRSTRIQRKEDLASR